MSVAGAALHAASVAGGSAGSPARSAAPPIRFVVGLDRVAERRRHRVEDIDGGRDDFRTNPVPGNQRND